jgi:hypothetical protein
MSVDKVGSVLEFLQTSTKIDTKTEKEHISFAQVKAGNEKTLVENAADVVDIIQISFPPLLPLGDTQSIYKIKK